MKSVCALYVIVTFFVSILFGTFVDFEAIDELSVTKNAFYVQRYVRNKYREEINELGLAIMTILTTLFCWPINFIIVVVLGLEYLFDLFWRGFKYIFRRKEK